MPCARAAVAAAAGGGGPGRGRWAGALRRRTGTGGRLLALATLAWAAGGALLFAAVPGRHLQQHTTSRASGPAASRLQMRAVGSKTAAKDQIEVLYDGLCRVCLTNKAVLESQDSEGVLRFVNIAAEEYDPSDHSDVDFEDAMNELHVILPDGEIMKGTEAVFRAYQAVGLDWAVGILSSPILRGFTDVVYKVISENRDFISKYVPGGDALRENLRSARFLQKGVAEGEGCNEEKEDEEDDDCTITEDKIAADMGL